MLLEQVSISLQLPSKYHPEVNIVTTAGCCTIGLLHMSNLNNFLRFVHDNHRLLFSMSNCCVFIIKN